MDKKIVHYLKQMPEQNKFLRGQIAWMGFKQTAVFFSRDARKYGKTNYSLKKMISFALDGITSFSDQPLRLVTKLGFVFSFLAFCIAFYAGYGYFFLDRNITGWTSSIVSNMLIGGIQLIAIGIIGEYISRINKNVLKRPLYVIKDTNLSRN